VRRVLVSGVTGHVGRVLSSHLAAAGFEVHGLSRQESREIRMPLGSVRLHRIDGRTNTLIEVLDRVRPQIVFHLAAAVHGHHESSSVASLVEANVLYGAQLLESMRVNGCRQIIFAGSYLQHGDSAAYRALNFYAATKQAFESLLEYYAEAFDFSAVRLTLCNVYSEREVRSSLMTDIATAWRDQTTLVVRNPEVRVDLVHAEDVARSFLRMAALMQEDAVPCGGLKRYSVTSGRDFSPAELVRLFEHIGRRKVAVEMLESSQPSRRARPWRGETVPGWQPLVSIEEGIARILGQTYPQTAVDRVSRRE
jgi:nucleoside-diphosphate-sugar epimerase